MTKTALIRCEKNENRCPLTGCFKSMTGTKEGFAHYESCTPAGVFTCRCPGDNAVELAKIIKSKGAEAIHFCTCTFAKKGENGWDASDGGFCDNIDEIIERVHTSTGLPCVKGSAHLPKGYQPRIWG
ncbi:MAG: CGGC domain-containing protein [Thermodesulfobacteriota bacterium]|nr:CGGC domain-containing protein [Thermodesulfobacteriota bacterium]